VAGKVRTADLINAVCGFYSPEFLESLECGPRANGYQWMQHLVHNHGRAQHPLQHLLLIQFLGYSAADFFRLPPKPPGRRTFGEGPWPCLNPVADHHGKPVITECEISSYRPLKKPRGTFRCSCGFVYARIGPDRSEDARYTGARLKYGKVWEDKFKEMYEAGRRRKEIAARLNICRDQVRIIASRLGPSPQKLGGAEGSKVVKDDLRDKYRREWLEAKAACPEAGRGALALKLPTPINWLRNNDREWLEENSPARRRPQPARIRIDWGTRDVEFSEAARREAERVRNGPGRPVRVTATKIAKAIGCLQMTSKRGTLLPLTVKTLAKVSESTEEIAVRRVEWAARCYRDEGIRPNKEHLRCRAGMSLDIAKRPPVMAAINAALLSIEPSERATAIIPVAA
jgi:hypothetical protein